MVSRFTGCDQDELARAAEAATREAVQGMDILHKHFLPHAENH